MPVEFYCDQCRHKLRVRDEFLGRKARCPACKAVVRVEVIPLLEEVAPPPADPAAITDRPPAPAMARPYEPDDPPRTDPDAATDHPRPARDFPPFEFIAAVKNDPQKALKGSLRAQVTPEGMRLRRGENVDLLVPRGTPAEHLEGNQMNVEVGDRTVTLAVVKLGNYQARIARDVVDFLAGDKQSLDARGYRLEWYLYVPVVLPIGIPIITLGGALWGGLGFGLAFVSFGIAQAEKVPKAARLTMALLLAVVGYGILGASLIPGMLQRNSTSGSLAGGPPTVQSVPKTRPRSPELERKPEVHREVLPPTVTKVEPPRPATPPQPAVPQPAGDAPKVAVRDTGVGIPVTKPLAVVFLPGSPILLTLDKDKKTQYWAPANALQLPEPPEGVSAAVTPDGGHLLVQAGNTFQLRRLEQGGLTGAATRDAAGREFRGVSSDGKYEVALKPAEHTARVLNRATGAAERTIDVGHAGKTVLGLALAPDGQTFAVSFVQDGLEVFDVATGKVRVRFGVLAAARGYFRPVFSPDGKALAAACVPGSSVALLNTATGTREQLAWQGANQMPLRATFSPDGKRLATGSLQGGVRVWDLETRKPLADYRVDPRESRPTTAAARAVTGVEFSPNGRFLAATDPSSVRVWDVSGLTGPATQPAPPAVAKADPPKPAVPPPAAAADKGAPEPPAGGAAKPAGNLDRDGGVTADLPEHYRSRVVALAPDGKTFAIGFEGGAGLWDVAGPTERVILPGGKTEAVALSADGKTVLTAESGGTVRLWDVEKLKQRRTFKASPERVTRVRLSPDGKTAAASGLNVRLWDTTTGQSKDFNGGADAHFRDVAYSPDGKTLAGSDDRGTIFIWNVADGKTVAKFDQGAPANVLAFSPDGKTLAAYADTRGVRLWDVAAGTDRPLTPTSRVRALAFSPDGKRLFALGILDVRVWDVASAKLADRHILHTGTVVALTPDGRLALSAADDAKLRIWDLSQLPEAGEGP